MQQPLNSRPAHRSARTQTRSPALRPWFTPSRRQIQQSEEKRRSARLLDGLRTTAAVTPNPGLRFIEVLIILLEHDVMPILMSISLKGEAKT
jgi:hypothetical protein